MERYMNVRQMKERMTGKLSHFMGVTPQNATDEQVYKALALVLRDQMALSREEFLARAKQAEKKKIYYLCMEFLMGRSLKNTLYNLNLTETAAEALGGLGIRLEKLFDCEPDAGLGNGGLGRLAACYLDALATREIPAVGYSILYEYGIFKQKLVDGWQTELPDFWLPGGECWLLPREENAVTIKFEGQVNDRWDEHYHTVEIENPKLVQAIPYDMFVAGKDGRGVSMLRLWTAKAPFFDMALFNQGDFMRAMEQNAMAETISKVLYPADNHPEGKSLRLRQQYFLVSASLQDLVSLHLKEHGTMDNLPDKVAIHINDTHPTMGIPELMRILLDECGYGWDDAWSLVTRSFAYTNHTVMREALECWQEELVARLMPRIAQIIREIDNRFRHQIWELTGDADRVERMAIVSNGLVRMANLCVAACHSVNGVSALHSQILKETVFADFYALTPGKFKNVTNGIAHRRWLCQANPRLSALIANLIGDKFVYDGAQLERLKPFAEDKTVLKKLQQIKDENKKALAALVKRDTGVAIDPGSLFDVQVKRLHEYKRQHLNALHILSRYLEIKQNPNGDFAPHTYIFGAKAAPGYFTAKKIISFIFALANIINNDPDVRGRLKVVYLEGYSVTMAEQLMPAAEISEQISLAGTEASGTGNMKLMLNGAITLGTMDGANVEICEAVGQENIIIFGLSTSEAEALRQSGYTPENYYRNNPALKAAIDYSITGMEGKPFPEIGGTILHHDPYMVLADFADYQKAQRDAEALWQNELCWNRSSLLNIAGAGRFAADRAILDYARDIWT